MTDKTQEKLNDLEMLIAHQDKQIQELNEIVTVQAGEIDTLKKYVKIKLDKIETNMQESGQEDHASVADEAAANKPPHY